MRGSRSLYFPPQSLQPGAPHPPPPTSARVREGAGGKHLEVQLGSRSTRLQQRRCTPEHLASRAYRPRSEVPPTISLSTNENGPRPPCSADLTSGPTSTAPRDASADSGSVQPELRPAYSARRPGRVLQDRVLHSRSAGGSEAAGGICALLKAQKVAVTTADQSTFQSCSLRLFCHP